jgi:hypothetical protein
VRPARRSGGQAAPELLAAVPLVLAAGLVAWQLVAAVWAGVAAQERVRADGLRAGAGAGTVTLEARVPVPALAPPLRGAEVRARAVVRAP